MIWDFFNQRHKVRSGSEAAYRLIMKETRSIIPPPSPSFDELQISTAASQPLDQHGGDLDFDKEAESYVKSSLSSSATDIEDARTRYYAGLPAKLETARALSRGTREPTKDEISHPPPTEVELRAERMKKELRWRGDSDGWELIRREKGVIWDERFATSMKVFVDPAPAQGDDQFQSKSD
jgi:import inner membrane translocase subunit TIM54